jgi:hypothetical protein
MSVLITVHDEANGTSRKFLSDGALLLSSMRCVLRNTLSMTSVTAQQSVIFPCRYFQEHVKHIAPGQTVEITVHCDCSIFAWLFSWVQSKDQNGTACPQITPNLVLPILISSSFLKVSVSPHTTNPRECENCIGPPLCLITACTCYAQCHLLAMLTL